jgi:hypothetical protein
MCDGRAAEAASELWGRGGQGAEDTRLERADVMMPQEFYWSGPPGLGVQQVVEPGAYWRRVMSVALIEARDQPGVGRVAFANAQTPAVLLEVILEWVRATEFPALPSRSTCHFAWEREDWAREYHHGLTQATLYEIQPAGVPRLFRADYALGNAFREHDTLGRMIERSRRYWRGEVEGRPEILIQGQLVIIRAII